jgi:thiol:disulfide interchange protein DsbA
MDQIMIGDAMNLLKRLGYLAALLALLAAGGSAAQPVIGRDYQLINPPRPTGSGMKIEVLEFFWYGCIHDERFFQVLDQLIAQAREEHRGK